MRRRVVLGTVCSDNPHDTSSGKIETEILKQKFITIRLGKPFCPDYRIAQSRPVGDYNLCHGDFLGSSQAQQLFISIKTRPALCLTGLVAHPYPLKLLLQAPLTHTLLFFLLSHPGGLLIQPGTVISFPRNSMRPVYFQNPFDHIVKEIPVVSDKNDRSLVLPQMTFEPGYRFSIQVVCRLIEQKKVGFLQK